MRLFIFITAAISIIIIIQIHYRFAPAALVRSLIVCSSVKFSCDYMYCMVPPIIMHLKEGMD